MPARAAFELDCRILPGTTEDDVEREVRARLGSGIAYELEWPEALVAGSASDPASALMDAMSRVLTSSGDDAALVPMMCTGFTDSVYLREAGTPTAYGFSPFRSTSAEVLTAGFHNADERVHIDDLLLAVEFHMALARDLLG
jgi:acetylornithine deacetylase/succinyl-diaminopimelate desuccinylase-like protein